MKPFVAPTSFWIAIWSRRAHTATRTVLPITTTVARARAATRKMPRIRTARVKATSLSTVDWASCTWLTPGIAPTAAATAPM